MSAAADVPYPGKDRRVPSSLVRARLAVITLFLLTGAMVGSWAARIPGVRAQVGLDDAQWGLVILAAPLGTLTALLIVTRIITRTGSRRLAIPGAIGVLVAIPVTATAQQVWVLALALLVQGAATGLIATPMNALAVLVERDYRRRIMSSFHACFSLGQLTGGVVGAVAASIGITAAVQLGATSLLLGAVLAGTFRWLPRDRPAPPVVVPAGEPTTVGRAEPAADADRQRGKRFRSLTPQLALLAAIALLSSISEGAATQWSAQYGAVTLAAGAGIGALTFTCYSVAMTVSRVFGDRIVDRLGRVHFLRISALVAGIGMAVGLAMGTTLGGFLAFGLLGVGCACIVPTVIGLAGNQPGLAAGRGVAVVSLGQWPAYLIGPPLIGGLAGIVGLQAALGVTALAALTIAVLAGRIHDPGHRNERLAASG